ncbi:MAG: hypothetical protein IK077_15770, partial [Thermoguttaceae bacterium]|nr:hypothetical protein [Thermoguttaceae bacterium]
MKKIYVFFAVVATCLTLSCYRQNAAWAQESDVPIAPQLKAAVFRDSGASDTCAIASLQILNNAPGFEASFISAQEIREGSLKNFDVVLFPGGTGSGESKALGDEGWKELRKFLNDGGGFIG